MTGGNGVSSKLAVLAGTALAVLVSSTSFVILADDANAVSARVRSACKGDYRRFCPQYEAGSPQARSCMQQVGRRRALSPRCFNALADAGYIPRKYLKDKRR